MPRWNDRSCQRSRPIGLRDTRSDVGRAGTALYFDGGAPYQSGDSLQLRIVGSDGTLLYDQTHVVTETITNVCGASCVELDLEI
jgi:hypothetical protein